MRNIILSLVFAITAIVVQAQEPVITMTTSQPNGSEVEFYLTSFGDNTLVMVDWGDGILEDFRIGQSNTTISGVTIGDAIKIYGPGITGLYASNLSLTSLDIFEAISLTSLTVSNNQLQSLDISGNTNLQYLDCSRNQLETLSLTTNIKLERISCFSNKLTTIDITSNAALWKLDCSNNLMTTLNFSAITKNVDIDCSNNLLTSLTLGKKMSSVRCKNNALTNLDVSQNTSLFLLDCSNNQINSLNLSNNANLQYLICSNNKLSSLDLSHNSSLTEVYCDNNKLTLATLPIKQTYWNVYSYNPQAIYSLPKKTYETGESIDLSSQLSVNGVNSVYTWKTKGGQTLSAGTHYTATNGVFVFNSVPTDSVYCEITNTDLTDITLTTKAIMVTEPVPNVVMTTATAVGSTFTFIIGSLANDTPIQIDWGNGSLENYTIGTSSTTVSGTLAGGTIKIYGLGIVRLDLSDKKLTALDVTNNTTLEKLSCYFNQLTALDVTNNTALTNLDCDLNQLTALDVSNNTALTNLDCDFNQLTALDVSNNTALIRLNCSSNQLTTLDVSNNTALVDLYCYSNQLTALDVSNNTALTTLFCSYNQLTTLDVINNTALEELDCSSTQLTALDVTKNIALTNLYCYNIQLTTLDVTNNTALEELYCSHNQLTALDVTNITALTSLNCYNNQLTALNLTNNTALTVLRCSDNLLTFSTLPVQHPNWTTYTYSPQEKLPLSKNEIALNEEIDLSSQLTAGGNTTTYVWKTIDGVALIKDVDYTENNGKFIFLKQLSGFFYCEMSNESFPELTLSTENVFITQDEPSITMTTTTAVGSTFSFYISATANSTPIQVDWGNGVFSNYTIGTSSSTVSGTLAGSTIKIYGLGIVHLNLSNNQLTALDVSNSTELKELECTLNQLTALDVTNNTALEKLECNNNQLTALDVTNNTALTRLFCSYNQLTALDVSNNIALTNLYCFDNQLVVIDVSNNTALTNLGCSDNQLTALDVSNNTALTTLFCSYNQLTTLDVINNTALEELDCSSNQLTALDVTNNTALEELYCSYNQLTALDVTNNTALTSLNCYNNQLTAFDVTNNTALTSLNCYNNQLTALNLTNNTALTVLRCPENLLTFSTLPIQHTNWTTYTYSPQGKLPLSKNEFALNEEIDLSSQLTAGGNTTTYVWKTIDGVALIKDVDYTENNGKFIFLKQLRDYFYCEMSNSTFPELILATENIFITQTEPSITMTTVATAGSTFSFSISATANNTPIKVDWGNGSLANYTIGYGYSSVSGTLAGNIIKIYGVGIAGLGLSNKELIALDVTNTTALTNLVCYGNQLTSLDLSNNTALTSLSCGFNQLTTVDVANNPALSSLYCSFNQITALDVTKNAAMTYLDCSHNQLTALDVTNNPALEKLECDNNQLTFSTLPIQHPRWTDYTYNPQGKLPLSKKEFALNEEIDLSSQLTAGDNTTTYVWKTIDGVALIKDVDYTENNGKFVFLKPLRDFFYCEMSNATFPELTLTTKYIFITQTEPSITMATATTVGSTFSFGISATVNNTPIKVDWGNGSLANYTIGYGYSSVSGALAGNIIKIYGVGIASLELSNKELTALDVTNTTALKKLECDYNQLTFSSLPEQRTNWTIYTYSPQSKLPLSKNEFALNEEIDLSSQLTAGGNTTTYLWKTKGGVMLIKDVDYTESNGKFTFLKQPGDYFYCEMSNATFPELTLATENVFITQTEPSITMTTTTAIGGTFSFTISATTYNTPIKVDWGNGSLVSYTIGWHSTVSGKLTGSTIKIYGVGISYLRISGELTALDVTNNIALTELDCSSNQLTALDVTNNTALYNLDCSSNQIIALDVTNNVALTKLACNKNQLTALDVTNNTALKLLSCVNNQLTFSALPVPNASWTTYRYSPQEKVSLAKTDYELNEEIDLSSQLTAGGNTTTYLWKTIGGVTLIKDVDYTESNGKFTFIKQPGDYFFCEMSNATFPELTLATENVFIIPDQPSITMTTAETVGSDFLFVLRTEARNVPIKIDWGNGILTNHTLSSDPFVSGTLAGNTIKIYGLGIEFLSSTNDKLTSLDVSNNTELTTVFCSDNQLTELNVSNTPALTRLDCSNNQLTSLDMSNSPALTSFYCYNNQLTFSTLPNKRSGMTYIYVPQSEVKLPKKQYALTEAVDLSSELDVNGNTTNYTWKTKGGATLVAGIDYNVVGGVTTFLKVQTDSVYCQMTNATFPELTLNTINIKVSAYPLSVEDNEVAISVYPNPASENFTIKMTEEIVRVEVYSITGVRVFENGQYSSPTVTVPLTNMPKGTLLIKAYTRNGVYSSKVVKI